MKRALVSLGAIAAGALWWAIHELTRPVGWEPIYAPADEHRFEHPAEARKREAMEAEMTALAERDAERGKR